MLNGKDKGKSAKISAVFPQGGKVLVEGLNLVKKTVRARKQGQKSQVISKERAVAISSVALVCKSCGKSTRIGYKFGEGDKAAKLRVCKKCGAEV